MRLDIVTIFPEYFGPLQLSLVGKAIQRGLVDVGVHDLRRWTHDRHRTVDDTPYGGGAGMVMKPEPWGEALDDLGLDGATLIVPTPSGRPLTQALARDLATHPDLDGPIARLSGRGMLLDGPIGLPAPEGVPLSAHGGGEEPVPLRYELADGQRLQRHDDRFSNADGTLVLTAA